MIVTPQDLINYHNQYYLDGNPDIQKFVNQCGLSIFDGEISSTKDRTTAAEPLPNSVQTGNLELNNLVLDEETLLNRLDQSDISNEQCREYLEAQKLHKAKFMDEIKSKGLQLKSMETKETKTAAKGLNY